ncbi:hypothetical protein LINPERHAP1_LOCUS34923 [Linum perenne]
MKTKEAANLSEHFQMWHRKGEYCPDGTVAILRSSTTDIPPKTPSDLTTSSTTNNSQSPTIFHPEYALAVLPGIEYFFYGANADINVWSPRIQPKELSVAQIWVTDGGGDKIETIEAGWMVTAFKPQPHLFTYWTYDGYGASGCYNLQCSGFVQTSPKISLGAELEPVSTYGGDQRVISIRIHRDVRTGNWWLNIQDIDVGYWPGDLFKNLKSSARVIEWGGRVINTNPHGFHTTTQMGSGRFPSEGYGKAAYFKNLEYIDGEGFPNAASDALIRVKRPECYDIDLKTWKKGRGIHFFYGGPGYSLHCQNATSG